MSRVTHHFISLCFVIFAACIALGLYAGAQLDIAEAILSGAGAFLILMLARSRWTAQSDFSLIRRPGNFSYTFAWLATGGFGRQFGSHVRIMGELLYDRHGSRGFEGFALSREEARLTFIWTLPRHPLGL